MSRESSGDEYMRQVKARLLASVTRVTAMMEGADMAGMVVKSIMVRGPEMTGAGYQAVIKGRDEAQVGWVAFANGNDVGELLGNIAREYEQHGLKWREDKPFDPSKGK